MLRTSSGIGTLRLAPMTPKLDCYRVPPPPWQPTIQPSYNSALTGQHRGMHRALMAKGGATADGAGEKGRKIGLASAWGVLSVLAILANAIRRLAPIAAQPLSAGSNALTTLQWVSYVGFVAIMVYAEGYKAFQRKFSPMVVKRALTLDESPGVLKVLLAGPYSMGLFHATKKRKIVSWSLTFTVVILIACIKKLPYPWRSVVDAGAVAGLSWGAVSILIIWLRAMCGTVPEIDAQLPKE